MNRRSFAWGAVLFCAGTAAAQPAATALGGDRFFPDGVEVRIADILAPAVGGPNGGAEPFAREARAILENVLGSGRVVAHDAMPSDRWGRRVVRATVKGDEGKARSLAEALIAEGAARVRPETDDAAFIAGLLSLEAEARAAKRGLWRDWRYAVFDAEKADGAVGSFSIVEGTVKAATARAGRVYLNFGEDYRTDFSATAKTSLARSWAKAGLDLAALAGARARVRGYVARINGPSIELTHVGQIETLAND